MGGAIAFLASKKSADLWTGVIFSGPGSCLFVPVLSVCCHFVATALFCAAAATVAHADTPARACMLAVFAHSHNAAIEADPSTATPSKRAAAKFLANALPKFTLGSLEADRVCSDPVVVQHYMNDPLVHKGGMGVRWGHCVLTALDQINRGAAGLGLSRAIGDVVGVVMHS